MGFVLLSCELCIIWWKEIILLPNDSPRRSFQLSSKS
jgi:hypothetical protein